MNRYQKYVRSFRVTTKIRAAEVQARDPPLNATITLPLFCILKSDRAKVQSCFINFIENNINFPKNFIFNFGLWEK